MLKKSGYILLLILLFVLQDAASQNSQVIYYMNIPQNHLFNPALRPTNKFYIGFPGLTGVGINVNNNFLKFSDVFIPGKDSVITFLHPDYNVEKFINKLPKRSFIAPEASLQLIGVGFNAGKDTYVFLDIIDKFKSNLVIPQDLFKLMLKGNGDFTGKTIDLSSLDLDAMYYREYGVGLSRDFGSKLRLGAKAKMLFGFLDFSLANKAMDLTIGNDFAYNLNADVTARMSIPHKSYFGADNLPDSIIIDDDRLGKANFFISSGNPGFAMDFGAVYDLTDRFEISASITDLGFITWKKNVETLKAESHFQLNGFNVTDVISGTKTIDQLANETLDSLTNSFTFTNDNGGYSTILPLTFSAGGSFKVSKNFSLGLLSSTIFSGKQVRAALTMSANLNLGNAFSTSLSYTAENHTYDNLGAGLAFRLGVVQLYFVADRIPIQWNKMRYETTSGSNTGTTSTEVVTPHTIVLPENLRVVNFRFGINLSFGNKPKTRTDKPMLLKPKYNRSCTY